MRKSAALLMFILLVFPYFTYGESVSFEKQDVETSELSSNITSIRNPLEDIIIVSDSDPLFGLIGSYVSCWYNTEDSTGFKPLLIQHDGILTDHQEMFIDTYLNTKNGSLLVLGEQIDTVYNTTELLGSPAEVAIETANHVFSMTSSVIIISNKKDDYQLSLTASPLSSYLDIPILIYDNNTEELEDICNTLNVSNAFVISDVEINLSDINITRIETLDEIQQMVLTVIKEKFGKIDYITLTNPSDVIPPSIIESHKTTLSDHISNIKITVLGKEFDVKGVDTKQLTINVPDGINRIQIYGNISDYCKKTINPIIPIIFLSLYDPSDNLVAYSSSFAYDFGSAYMETLTVNLSGTYKLVVRIYNGLKGGFFIQRGLSIVDTDFEISLTTSELENPHLPLVSKLSMTASYLTAAHGGIILADSNFELTDKNYATAASGSGTGPCYNEELHNFTNEKVGYIVDQLNHTLECIEDQQMLSDYLNGPAWLAILAGTNMIPMYYYGPSQPGLYEKGLPSDNPYSLNENLSIGRIVGWNVEDVSLFIARTLFYEEICGQPEDEKDWHNRFHFIFGEGFGETGGIFHQIPYSREIREYGFYTKVFGDLRNNRLFAELFKVYIGSNYIEYLGHGDWFWFSPSFYGIDYYSKAIDVAHVKDWTFDKPGVFFTSSCLMARIDGIPPRTNIGVAMLHAGCNGFIGATRETGQEAGLSVLENHLIIDNYSIGEALRGEKKIDKEPPTYYVRVLYGDPAFNPYEPNNGFSSQGRPELL